MERIRAAVWGTGRAGSEIVKVGLTRPWLELRAGIVFNAAKHGLDLGELCGAQRLDIPVTTDAEDVLSRDDIDVVFFAGIGSHQEVAGYCRQALQAGKDVITVSGIVHPPSMLGEPGARELDSAARSAGRRVIGTGLFPGFLMDVLPIATISNVVSFEELRCERVADMSRYGDGVLEAEGIGRRPEEASGGFIGNSLRESLGLLAEALNVQVAEHTFSSEPIVTDVLRQTDRYRAEPGTICGYRRKLEAPLTNGSRIVLQWQGMFDLRPERDGMEGSARVAVRGVPNVDVTVKGDLFTDTYPTTAARAMAAVRPIRRLPPGLYTVDQLPLTPAFY